MAASPRRRLGFTLIELMIVVAIIGLLAAIAIPNFVRFQLRSKSSEGKTNLASIRTAEESYFAANGSYLAAATSPAMLSVPASSKQPFVDVGPAGANFTTLGWAPEGQVSFRYAVAVMAPDYTADAEADIDADGMSQRWGYARTTGNAAPTLAGALGCTGAWDAATSMANLPNQVGPCDGSSGQSLF